MSLNTVAYASGKEAVIVFPSDDLSAVVISKLARLGVQHIISRSAGTAYIDVDAAAEHKMTIYKVDVEDPMLVTLMEYPEVLITPQQAKLCIASLKETANQTIINLDHAGRIGR